MSWELETYQELQRTYFILIPLLLPFTDRTDVYLRPLSCCKQVGQKLGFLCPLQYQCYVLLLLHGLSILAKATDHRVYIFHITELLLVQFFCTPTPFSSYFIFRSQNAIISEAFSSLSDTPDPPLQACAICLLGRAKMHVDLCLHSPCTYSTFFYETLRSKGPLTISYIPRHY